VKLVSLSVIQPVSKGGAAQDVAPENAAGLVGRPPRFSIRRGYVFGNMRLSDGQ